MVGVAVDREGEAGEAASPAAVTVLAGMRATILPWVAILHGGMSYYKSSEIGVQFAKRPPSLSTSC